MDTEKGIEMLADTVESFKKLLEAIEDCTDLADLKEKAQEIGMGMRN
jgi:DNA-binding PadR family transcriptional regulator